MLRHHVDLTSSLEVSQLCPCNWLLQLVAVVPKVHFRNSQCQPGLLILARGTHPITVSPSEAVLHAYSTRYCSQAYNCKPSALTKEKIYSEELFKLGGDDRREQSAFCDPQHLKEKHPALCSSAPYQSVIRGQPEGFFHRRGFEDNCSSKGFLNNFHQRIPGLFCRRNQTIKICLQVGCQSRCAVQL